MGKKTEEPKVPMVRIAPAIYEQMTLAAARDGRSIAKEVEQACKEFLRLTHPAVASGSVEMPPKKDHPKGKD